ncbi:hypothetical protein MJH12_13515, partial [bacterium]|nr:hypothetical protein [bacterium]
MSQYQISESLIHLYQEGGFIMIPLALLSIISLSILSEKLLFYLKYLGSYFRRCRFDIPQSVLLYQNNPHNFYHKQILFESLTNEHKIASRFYLQKSQKEVYKIQRSLWFLQMSIQLAPILGVLGTII